MELYELIERPDLERPVLVMAMEGWIDAGMAAGVAASTLVDEMDTVTVARFDTDTLIDYRSRRPTVRMANGVLQGLSWPAVELKAATDLEGNELLLLVGAEPDRAWHEFVDAVVHLALDFDVRMCIGLGAYPAPAPHTRPARMACCASTANLADMGFIRASLNYPGGVQVAVEQACNKSDIPSLGLWAQVPHYAAAIPLPYPAASIALIQALERMAGLSLPVGDLPTEADTTRERLNELISQNHEHQEMLQQLETAYEQIDTSPENDVTLPTGDELAAELERFLRDQ